MKAVKIKNNIYWVGGIDWSLRNFHGYKTQRGSSYNAYLIIDEKITLIDTVKYYLFDEMLERISSVTDPSKIDYLICNHVEMDHSGCLPWIWKRNKKATIIASPKGKDGLTLHYGEMNCKTVKTGEILELGKKTLQFVHTPMVHWPDNMVTYCPEEKVLFSNDGFGQHIASTERFDDQYPIHIVMKEAEKYYANIVLPYGNQVKKALSAVADLDIQTIAPSHGVIWRKYITNILHGYTKWSANETDNRALVVYDTMWDSTRKIAYAIQEAFETKNINSELICLQDTHISDVMASLLTAKYLCIGSPTLNNNLMPTIGAFLTYLKGLSPKKRIGLPFGSYGWSGESAGLIELELESMGFTMWDPIKVQYLPSKKRLKEITETVVKNIG